MKISTRLVVTHVALATLGMAAVTTIAFVSFDRWFVGSISDDLHARAQALGASVDELLANQRLRDVSAFVDRYGAQEDITLRVFNAEGRLLATSEQSDPTDVDWRQLPGVAEATSGRGSHGRAPGVGGKEDRLYEATPLVSNGAVIGALRISRSLASYQREVRRTVLGVALAVGGAFVGCVLLGILIARSIARPLQRINAFAVRLGAGGLGERLQLPRHDEIGALAEQLDLLSQRLAKLDDERRAFLATASHELRTPVSNIHVTLETLTSGAKDDPADRDRFLALALDETKRLATLVHDLLDLGRLESGVVALERRPISTDALVRRAVSGLEARARARSVALEVSSCSTEILVDPERLLQALVNVLDNALKFSPSGGAIRIVAEHAGADVTLRIVDEGPGIEQKDLPHVFEQFYTGDPSRKRGGVGLGLAISRRIITAHGGRIEATNGKDGGTTITITLPVAWRAAA